MTLVSLSRENRDEIILKFIQENEPCTFGQIKDKLVKEKIYFKITDKENNKPLSRQLEKLSNDGKIIRDGKAKPYPTYSTVQDYSIDNAIMGDAFRKNYVDTFFTPLVEIDDDYIKKDIPLDSRDSDDEKLIKSMVIRYGFYMLATMVKSYEQTITRKNYDRKIWIENALNIMKDEPLISTSFVNILGLPDPSKKKNKKLLKNRLKDLRKVMDETYPKMHLNVNLYDAYIEKNPEKIRSRDIEKINLD